MHRIVVDHDFPQSPARVFAHLAEHENLAPVFGAKITRLTDGTDGKRNGVGSSRKLRIGPLPGFVETTTEHVPDELIRYRITKGSPLRDHEGVMRFAPRGEGTHLHYEIVFRTVIPGLGALLAPVLKRNIEQGLKGVEKSA